MAATWVAVGGRQAGSPAEVRLPRRRPERTEHQLGTHPRIPLGFRAPLSVCAPAVQDGALCGLPGPPILSGPRVGCKGLWFMPTRLGPVSPESERLYLRWYSDCRLLLTPSRLLQQCWCCAREPQRGRAHGKRNFHVVCRAEVKCGVTGWKPSWSCVWLHSLLLAILSPVLHPICDPPHPYWPHAHLRHATSAPQ